MTTWNKKGGWLLLADGLVLLAGGFYSIINPFHSYVLLVKYTGAILLTGSIFHFLMALKIAQERMETIWLLLESALDLVGGLLMIFNPLMTALAYPLFLIVWLMGSGLLKVIAGVFFQRFMRHPLPVVIAGLVYIIFASLLLNGAYRSTGQVSLLFGLFGITAGGLFIFDAVYYRKTGDNIDYLV